ncbi:cytosol aminopeptidase [Candidatus Blochmanniella vafra str. BVAF]|uniref:Probable cytosol aminopeptidase n=1 Tax=Blochmanniella vafra (strain BVAF) TaxID=859654 RepID=E8Q6K7_BLOVB|nr:leucyl aminopeptidase [Candidatus Blochmannia vafer]ADV33448.1 cytosol aminopeptidase [Candidatus Blochmannia vafer str. BVAF]
MLTIDNTVSFKITDDYLKADEDACILTGVFEEYNLFPATEHINNISQEYIYSLLQRSKFNGSLNQHLLLYDIPYFLNRHILLVGCGKSHKFNSDTYIKILCNSIKFCKSSHFNKILLLLSELNISGYESYWKIRHSISIINDIFYTFNKFKSHKHSPKQDLSLEVILYINNPNELHICKKAIKDGSAIAYGINIAKNLSNMPPNYCTPNYLSHKVLELPNYYTDLNINILDESHLTKIGMNSYLAVGKGSKYSSVMPIIKYKNNPIINHDPIILIGKGVTFDSGGISIKPSNNMDEMKYDMCGAAVVYAIMCIVSKLKLPINIIGILAISENMISNKSLKPGDVISTLSGKTIEVLNTDAEGRLVLCDVLTFAERYHPSIVIDIATLTGACVVALGKHFSGLMTDNHDLAKDLIYASEQTRDYIWRLPLHESFDKQLQSTIADMTNIGDKSGGGAITAACFLKKFTQKYNWAHLDIAGTAWISNEKVKSSTGRPVELLTQFLINSIKQD